MKYIIITIALLLPGCAGLWGAQQAPVAVDTFCLTAKKKTWSRDDSFASIEEAERWNRAIDIRCGVPGKTSQPVS